MDEKAKVEQESITDVAKNLEFNRSRWGNENFWRGKDKFGYRWGGGYQQTATEVCGVADRFLRPHLDGRYDLKILELSPGGGRFTAELLRYARSLALLDMNTVCLELCKERFQYIPTPIELYANDGSSCDMIEARDFDLIACFDSMVHMHPEVIRGYVTQLGDRLVRGGVLWLDHAGKGAEDKGHRTDMTPSKMQRFMEDAGLMVVAQYFRNGRDCISVARK